jgi:hypothetical protein
MFMPQANANQVANRRFPEGFAKVRLRLARERAHPQGSQADGYDLVVPLDKTGRIDVALWKSNRELCRVVHYRSDEEHDVGHLVRGSGGQWKFHYDVKGDEDDPAGYRFSEERFTVGEYISIIEMGEPHTYRVMTVENL